MAVVYENNVSTTIVSAIGAGATSLQLTSATGWPAIASGDHTWVTLDDGTNVEVVKATALSGTTLTIEATTNAWAAGDMIEIRDCKELLDDISGSGASMADGTDILRVGVETSATWTTWIFPDFTRRDRRRWPDTTSPWDHDDASRSVFCHLHAARS